MARFRIVTPAAASFTTAGGGYGYEMEALEGFDAEIVECPATQEGFIAAAKGADAVYAKGMKFNVQMIQALDACRIIALGSVGVDYVDVAAATEKGIPVTNCPDTFIEEVADHAMMLLLATHRRAIEQDRMVREGRWSEGRPQLLKVPRLMGQTLGFIAFGRVARATAKRAKAFGLRLMAYDPFLDELAIAAEGVEPASLSEVLSQSDFVSMHLPATPEAVGFLKEKHFKLMKKTAIFINTGRGPTVDEPALIKALKERLDRGRRTGCVSSGAGEGGQSAAWHAARGPFAAQCLGLCALRSRTQAACRPGNRARSLRTLANVVREPDGVAGEWAATLAAGVDGAGSERLASAERRPYLSAAVSWRGTGSLVPRRPRRRIRPWGGPRRSRPYP